MISVQLSGSLVAGAVELSAADEPGWTTRRFLEFTGAFLSLVDATAQVELDLCGFSRGGEPGQWKPRGAVAVHLKVLPVPARRTEAGGRLTIRNFAAKAAIIPSKN